MHAALLRSRLRPQGMQMGVIHAVFGQYSLLFVLMVGYQV